MPEWLKQERGSFTLESALVFPLLLAFILCFMLFGMYLYQKAILYYSASMTAERAAFSWDNSNRDPGSGMLPVARYDSLYRSLGSDEALAGLLGLNAGGAGVEVTLPVKDAGDAADRLSYRKISRAAARLSEAGLNYDGRISYLPERLQRIVEVKLEEPLALAAAGQRGLWREPGAISSAVIVDPVEFIRSVDLVRYYTARFLKAGGGADEMKGDAGRVLEAYREIAPDKEE